MKWLRILTIILIVMIVVSISVTIILTQTYSVNKGSIEGTGFIIQEWDGAGGVKFDVDDKGNIYFALLTKGIVVYNNKGDYIYSLPVRTGGDLGVKIDEDNNILVYVVRKNLVIQYNNKGKEMTKIEDNDYSLENNFAWRGNENVRERSGIRYDNINGTITKEENGVETVVFTIPTWQRWKSAFSLVLILSIVALFLRIAIPQWIKAYKARYG